MIKINTSHILPDVPYLLEGTESSDVLGLPPDAVPPLVPAGDITYRLSAVMAGADLVVTGSASVPILTSCAGIFVLWFFLYMLYRYKAFFKV